MQSVHQKQSPPKNSAPFFAAGEAAAEYVLVLLPQSAATRVTIRSFSLQHRQPLCDDDGAI